MTITKIFAAMLVVIFTDVGVTPIPFPETIPGTSTAAPDHCPAISKHNISWPRTQQGATMYEPCPGKRGHYADWKCGRDTPASWIGEPDVSQCGNDAVADLSGVEYCPSVSRLNMTWPRTKKGYTAFRTCPGMKVVVADWICGTDSPPSWKGEPNTMDCQSETLKNFESG